MNDDYRKQYLEKLAKSKSDQENRNLFSMIDRPHSALESSSDESPAHVQNEDELQRAIAIVFDSNQELKNRLLALEAASIEIGNSDIFFTSAIKFIQDGSQPIEFRSGLLTLIRQSSFQSLKYQENRPEIFAALRNVVNDLGAPKGLRMEAAEFLAINKDDTVQSLLTKGLEDPSVAIFEPHIAVKYLSHDIHAVRFEKLAVSYTHLTLPTKA